MSQQRRIAIALRVHHYGDKRHAVLSGVQQFAREHGHWKCVVDETPGESGAQGGGPQGYDGVVARASTEIQEQLAKLSVPLVNTMYGQDRPDLPGVYVDAQAAGEMAAEHLLDRGFRRLAYLVEVGLPQSVAIAEAYARCAKNLGHSCTEAYFDTGMGAGQDLWRVMHYHVGLLFDRLAPPVGLLVSLPLMARVAAMLCEERGWRVPQDVAILCSENVPSVLDSSPQITRLDCNYEQIGYQAAALLERMIADPATPPQQIRLKPRGMIIRESTDYFAVDDEMVAEALQFICANLRENLTIIRLADELSVSQRTLQRRFEAALGRPIATEIRRLRLEAAKRLLTHKHIQINQIVREVGFGSPASMHLIFQRELGMSPTDYRRRFG